MEAQQVVMCRVVVPALVCRMVPSVVTYHYGRDLLKQEISRREVVAQGSCVVVESTTSDQSSLLVFVMLMPLVVVYVGNLCCVIVESSRV